MENANKLIWGLGALTLWLVGAGSLAESIDSEFLENMFGWDIDIHHSNAILWGSGGVTVGLPILAYLATRKPA